MTTLQIVQDAISSSTGIYVSVGFIITILGLIWWIVKLAINYNRNDVRRENEIGNLRSELNTYQTMVEKSLIKHEADVAGKIEELHQTLSTKIDRVEENSKTFYKHLDAKFDKQNDKLDKLIENQIKMSQDIAVHIANCNQTK